MAAKAQRARVFSWKRAESRKKPSAKLTAMFRIAVTSEASARERTLKCRPRNVDV